jgi:transposase InsO family protein
MGMLRADRPGMAWPAKSTACALLKKEGLIRTPRRRDRPHAPASALAPITAANTTWTTDFKGEFRTGDGRYCYPLTLRDGFSRYVLRCDALLAKSEAVVRPRFEQAFQEFGLPQRIRSDNGGPFAATGLTRLSRLSVWWIRLGIYPERIALGHPEQNGSHEQFHRVLKAETVRPPAANALAQQRRFGQFMTEYNHVRPHEALADRPPASCYTASSRRYPRRLPAVEYAGHLDVRRVTACGQVWWRGRPLYLAEALAGEHVGFEEVADGIWRVHFSFVRLAQVDARTRQLSALRFDA